MVITTVDIINKKKKVVLVFHDKEDGMWEFLDGEDVSEESAAIISISEMEQIDSSIGELCDLPLGCGAFPWWWNAAMEMVWNRMTSFISAKQ